MFTPLKQYVHLLDLDFIPTNNREHLEVLLLVDEAQYVEDILKSMYDFIKITTNINKKIKYDLIVSTNKDLLLSSINYENFRLIPLREEIDEILDIIKKQSLSYKISSQYFIETQETVYVFDISKSR